MYKLYLDDQRKLFTRYPDANVSEWVIAKNYVEFVEVIDHRGIPEFVSFDFDLGVRPNPASVGKKTGLDCAKYLFDVCMDEGLRLPKWKVHSANKKQSPKLYAFLVACEKILNT